MTSGIDIHDASQRGNIAAITTYTRAGGNLYAEDKQGNPPLHVASWHGQEASVAALLGAGVDPAALNAVGLTPIHYAEKRGHARCAALLRGEVPANPQKSSSPSQHRRREGVSDGDGDKERASNKKKKKKDKKKTRSQSDRTGTGGSADGGENIRSPSLSKQDKKAPPTAANEVPAVPPPLLPPPPSTAPSAVGPQVSQVQSLTDKLQSEWHLSHDENGNAYYYNESTGESMWAGAEVDEKAAAGSAAHQTGRQQTPDGWSFHHDPASGHAYYLDDATHESVWARADGSFPGLTNGGAAVAEGDGLLGRSDGGGLGDACADWDAAILFASDVPAPTAPLPFSPSSELAEASADAADRGYKREGREHRMGKGGEEDEVDKSMLLCTQGVMATNAFFAARELEVCPTSSGGSPMASAPPAAESGGRRSFCSPSPATAAAPDAGDDSGSVSDHEERSASVKDDGHPRGGRDNSTGEINAGVQTYNLDFGSVNVEGVVAAGRSTPDASHSATPSSSKTGPQSFGRESPSSKGIDPSRTGPSPARIGVWDTAKTKASGSPISLVRTAPDENHGSKPPATFGHGGLADTSAAQLHQQLPQQQQPAGHKIARTSEAGAIAGNGRDERVDMGDSQTLDVNENLVESSAAREPTSDVCVSGGDGASSRISSRYVSPIVVRSVYPKLVDREVAPGGDRLGVGIGGGIRNGTGHPESAVKGNGEAAGSKDETGDVADSAAAVEMGLDVDGALTTAVERSLTVGSDGKTSKTDAAGLKNGT